MNCCDTLETAGNKRKWLPDMDLNHDKQIQSLLCYRYTIGQSARHHPRRSGPPVKLDRTRRSRPCPLNFASS